MLGSAIATCISDIPFDGRLPDKSWYGMTENLYLIQPAHREQYLILSLLFASTRDKVIMIEAGAMRFRKQR